MIKTNLRFLEPKNWTQADLAEKVGISRQAVISIEKYKYTPSLELAFDIAAAFKNPSQKYFINKGGN